LLNSGIRIGKNGGNVEKGFLERVKFVREKGIEICMQERVEFADRGKRREFGEIVGIKVLTNVPQKGKTAPR
jgi:hypothetical protein